MAVSYIVMSLLLVAFVITFAHASPGPARKPPPVLVVPEWPRPIDTRATVFELAYITIVLFVAFSSVVWMAGHLWTQDAPLIRILAASGCATVALILVPWLVIGSSRKVLQGVINSRIDFPDTVLPSRRLVILFSCAVYACWISLVVEQVLF